MPEEHPAEAPQIRFAEDIFPGIAKPEVKRGKKRQVRPEPKLEDTAELRGKVKRRILALDEEEVEEYK
jgi:hypothetical protein